MRVRRVKQFGAILVALSLAGSALGCDRKAAPPSEAVVDEELVAFLSEARAFHHVATLKEEAGDLEGAAAAIERLLVAQRPHPNHPTAEVEEVLADAFARLGELRLKQGDLERASAAVKSGISHTPDTSYFRGHLVEIDGLVEEARAAALTDAGSANEAAAARGRAIAKLEEAVRIQDEVIRRSLAKDAGGSR